MSGVVRRAVVRGTVLERTDDIYGTTTPQRADAHAWAARIREQMGWAGCADPAHLVDTPFRRKHRWPPIDECVLRDRARRQLAESRTAQ
jgi:hypothetical protein